MLRKFKQQQKASQRTGFHFFGTFIRFCLQNNKESKIKKFKVLKNTNIFSHDYQIQNARALKVQIGKSKILRKFKQQMMFA